MQNNHWLDVLKCREVSVTLENVLDNAKAGSGGDRDMNFLKFLIDQKLLIQSEAILKRTQIDFREEYYQDQYKKVSYESDRHFYCRVIIQEELHKLGIETFSNLDIGNMNILRASANYDIISTDFHMLIDIGLTPARNFFRGLTDTKVKSYLITTFFDDYMDDIIFSVFSRRHDVDYNNAVREYEEGFKVYAPHVTEMMKESLHNNQPTI